MSDDAKPPVAEPTPPPAATPPPTAPPAEVRVEPTVGTESEIAGDLGVKTPEAKPAAVPPSIPPVEGVPPPAEEKRKEEAVEKPAIEALLGDFLKQQKEVVDALKPKPVTPPPPAPLKLYEVTPEMYEQFLESPEKGVQVLNEISKQTTAQTLRYAMAVIQEVVKPLQDHVNYQVVQQAEERFTKKYADLKDDVDICREIATKTDVSQFKTEEQLFEHVAKQAREFIARYKARFGVTPPAGNGQVPPTVPPKPAPRGAPASAKTEEEKDFDLLFGARNK